MERKPDRQSLLSNPLAGWTGGAIQLVERAVAISIFFTGFAWVFAQVEWPLGDGMAGIFVIPIAMMVGATFSLAYHGLVAVEEEADPILHDRPRILRAVVGHVAVFWALWVYWT